MTRSKTAERTDALRPVDGHAYFAVVEEAHGVPVLAQSWFGVYVDLPPSDARPGGRVYTSQDAAFDAYHVRRRIAARTEGVDLREWDATHIVTTVEHRPGQDRTWWWYA